MSYGQDLELMALVAAGDPVAQRAAVRRLVERAERLSRSLLRSAADASDASQASLIEILRCARDYRGESSLERWADRIVARTALRMARAERRARGAEPVADEVGPAVEHGGEAALMIQRCLHELPDAQRAAIVLRHVFEYSVEEIAELTDVSPNTVKDRLLRGREQIRRMVRRDESAASSGRRGSR